MEGLVALGLVCNVFQIISFAHELYDVSKRVVKDGSPDTIALRNASSLAASSQNLAISLHSAPKPITREQQQLEEIAQKCLEVSRNLQKELDFTHTKGWRKTFNPAKAIWKKDKIEKKMQEMTDMQMLLQMHLAKGSWLRTQAIAAAQDDGFNSIDAKLQHFINRLAEGRTELVDLVTKEAATTRDHITKDGFETRNTVQTEAAATRTHVTSQDAETRRKFAADIAETGGQLSTLTLKEATSTRTCITENFQDLENRAEFEKASSVLQAQYERLLKSLKFPEMNARRNQTSIDSHEATLEWVFTEGAQRRWDSFSTWLESTDTHYWISGKAGSGKSTLMKFLISDPRTLQHLEKWSHRPLILSYFLWNSGSAMQRNRKGMLCSLVYQILETQSDILNRLEDQAFIWKKEFLHDWSEPKLERLFFECLSKCSRPVGVFLDGLDEIDQAEGPADLIQFVRSLVDLPDLKICVSSRPEPEFKEAFKNVSKMRLQDLTEEDIRRVVTAFLEENYSNSTTGAKQRKELIDLVLDKAAGVFLWVHLALKSLQRGNIRRNDWETLRSRLDVLPSDLMKLYQEMWRRLGDDEGLYRQEAAWYFNLVLDDSLWRHNYEGSLFLVIFARSKTCQMTLAKLTNYAPLPHPCDLMEECDRERERIEDYSAGLLEISHTDVPRPPLGDYADRIHLQTLFAEKRRRRLEAPEHSLRRLDDLHIRTRVTFIHRSAANFLLDTKDGQDILACDRTTASERVISLVQAECFAILSGIAVVSFFDIWRKIAYTNIHVKVADSQLIPPCEAVFYRLLQDLEIIGNRVTGRSSEISNEAAKKALELVDDFIDGAAEHKFSSPVRKYMEYLRGRGSTVTDKFKSYVLWNFCRDMGRTAEWIQDGLIAWLLQDGADPNFSKLSARISSSPRTQILSAFDQFLFNIADIVKYNTPGLVVDDIAARIREFISRGADVTRKICFLGAFVCSFAATMSPYLASNDELYFGTMWQVNVAQLVQMIVDAVINSCYEDKESAAIDVLRGLGHEGYACWTRLLLLGTDKGRGRYGVWDYKNWYVASSTSKRSLDEGPHNCSPQSTGKLERALQLKLDYRALVWEMPVRVDGSVWELIKQVQIHCERIAHPYRWLHTQGFSSDRRVKMPEPFHGFSEVYGGSSSIPLGASSSIPLERRVPYP